jgi:hypothetical protein
LLTLLAAIPCRADAPATLAPEALRPGDPAILRTVMHGDSIEEFPAEIVGVLSSGRVEGQLIIAKATSERLKQLGVAQGMSGSPVYVGGKLIGALSSSWLFEREPLFGITPIGEMLKVLEHPSAPATGPAVGPAGVEVAAPPRGVRFGEFHWGDEKQPGPSEGSRAQEATPAATAGSPVALPIPLACAGLAPGALPRVQQWLEPAGFNAVEGGLAASGGPTASSLEPGSAVAVDLLRGDLRLAAIGTLTWRDGDRVLLFGHPFFQSGNVRLPLSTAQITTVISSNYVSFKLGTPGREVGVVTQDRHSGVAGVIGPRARLLPLEVRVAGTVPQPRTFHFEMVQDRSLASQLAAAATLNCLLESGGTAASQTTRWTLTFHRHGEPPLVVGDVETGEAPLTSTVASITAALAFLFGNPFETLQLDSLAVAVQVEPGRQEWTLRDARLLESAVRPGGRAHVACRIERWRGATETRVLEVPVAEELPNGRYSLWVGGGAELSHFEATRFPARFQPVSLDDAWRRLARLRPADALYAAIFANAPDVTAGGRDYPELPASAAVVLSSRLAAGDAARLVDAALLGETRLPLTGATQGELQLVLTVDSKAP